MDGWMDDGWIIHGVLQMDGWVMGGSMDEWMGGWMMDGQMVKQHKAHPHGGI